MNTKQIAGTRLKGKLLGGGKLYPRFAGASEFLITQIPSGFVELFPLPTLGEGFEDKEIFTNAEETAIENDRLRSRLTEKQRECDLLKSQWNNQQEEMNRLLDAYSAIKQENERLTGLLLLKNTGRAVISEYHHGVVEENDGERVTVVYDEKKDIIEHQYVREQFVDDQLPKEGERLIAHVLVVRDDKSLVPEEGCETISFTGDNYASRERNTLRGSYEF